MPIKFSILKYNSKLKKDIIKLLDIKLLSNLITTMLASLYKYLVFQILQ